MYNVTVKRTKGDKENVLNKVIWAAEKRLEGTELMRVFKWELEKC